jgi:hypothetical protein
MGVEINKLSNTRKKEILVNIRLKKKREKKIRL